VSGLQRSNCENDFNFNFNFKRGLWGMAKFDPERMAVYRLAREHTRAVHMLTDTVPARGFADLINQLRRAAASIPANVLEAAGEWRVGKRLNYLMIAKGSTCECWAHTDSLVDFGIVRADAITDVRDLQSQITGLLITTIRTLEAQPVASENPTQPRLEDPKD
jgi:four helix bundle protein